MSVPRKALIVVTSAKATLFDGKETTGMFVTEALHPFKVLRQAGFDVDLASETGSYTPDWLSLQADFLNGEDLATWNDEKSEFRQKLAHLHNPSDLNSKNYGLFFASAGHAALIDYPTASGLQRIAEDIYARGGVLGSTCHGTAIFSDIKDLSTGLPVIKGKKVTGFTTEGENVMIIMNELNKWNVELNEDLAARLGATCECDGNQMAPLSRTDQRSSGVWDDFHVVDGRIVTGMNPASAASTAKAAVSVFDKN